MLLLFLKKLDLCSGIHWLLLPTHVRRWQRSKREREQGSEGARESETDRQRRSENGEELEGRRETESCCSGAMWTTCYEKECCLCRRVKEQMKRREGGGGGRGKKGRRGLKLGLQRGSAWMKELLSLSFSHFLGPPVCLVDFGGSKWARVRGKHSKFQVTVSWRETFWSNFGWRCSIFMYLFAHLSVLHFICIGFDESNTYPQEL